MNRIILTSNNRIKAANSSFKYILKDVSILSNKGGVGSIYNGSHIVINIKNE